MNYLTLFCCPLPFPLSSLSDFTDGFSMGGGVQHPPAINLLLFILKFISNDSLSFSFKCARLEKFLKI